MKFVAEVDASWVGGEKNGRERLEEFLRYSVVFQRKKEEERSSALDRTQET